MNTVNNERQVLLVGGQHTGLLMQDVDPTTMLLTVTDGVAASLYHRIHASLFLFSRALNIRDNTISPICLWN